MAAEERYTVIRESGKSQFYDDKSYFTILDIVAQEFMSAGSVWDRPNMLLLNGKVVIEKGLASIAYDYGKFKTSAFDAARKETEAKFWPEWL